MERSGRLTIVLATLLVSSLETLALPSPAPSAAAGDVPPGPSPRATTRR